MDYLFWVLVPPIVIIPVVLFVFFFIFLSRYQLKCVYSLIRILVDSKITTRSMNSKKQFSVADMFESRCDANPNRCQFITAEEGISYSLQDIDKLANQIANFAIELQLTQKSTVALMLLNRPEFVAFWLGMAKVGCSTALLNTNLSGATLVHIVNTALKSTPSSNGYQKKSQTSTKLLVVDDDIEGGIAADLEALHSVVVYTWSAFMKKVQSQTSTRPPISYRDTITQNDPLLFIFTSGTTGLPKGAKISQSRFMMSCLPYQHMCFLSPSDRVYCPLPLYHSAGGMMGVGACIRGGITMVLRKKFSVRKFAEDCYVYKCTSTQYIGELCRYLVSSPHSEFDSKLILKHAYGNGLRPEVWTQFQSRYNIGAVVEFYGSTEGNIALFNSTGAVGAIGYIPRALDYVYPVRIVKMDPDSPETPLRDPLSGKCTLCADGEAGLVLSLIKAGRAFEGYSDKSATQKKIICDVLEREDRYFNTGDTMKRDAHGYFYWCDRVGDTFRWKGENVSTVEVAEVVVRSSISMEDVAVYGVSVPGYDGKIGMAAIVKSPSAEFVDFDAVVTACRKNLPSYSWPVFVRIVEKIPLTTTFKHKKTELAIEGFDVKSISDSVYFFRNGKFEPLTEAVLKDILSLVIRL